MANQCGRGPSDRSLGQREPLGAERREDAPKLTLGRGEIIS